MKKYIITDIESLESSKNLYNHDSYSVKAKGGEDMQVSDGYHTMDELYEHRIILFITLCFTLWNLTQTNYEVWRSELHNDGSKFGGWFILGINKEKGEQITYHLPLKYWEKTDFAETLEKAPEFDGHTSGDVLERLIKLI
jgi:hypothetical protein